MAKVSITRAWAESRELLSREGKALTAVALALLVLPGLVADLFTPKGPTGEMPEPGLWLLPVAISFLIALVGQLAIIRIASGTRTTVGAAIAHAMRRAPVYIGATILWMLPFLLLVVLVSVAARPGETPSAGMAVVVLIASLALLIGGLLVFVRMLMSGPVASNEQVGPVGVLRRSWDLTRGNWLRLFGFFLLFMIAAVVVLMFASMVAGILGRLVSGDPEPMTVGALLISLVTQLVGAAVSAILSVMLARIYVQITGSGEAEVSVPTSADH